MNEVCWHSFSYSCTLNLVFNMILKIFWKEHTNTMRVGNGICHFFYSVYAVIRSSFGFVFVFLHVKDLGISVGTRNLGSKGICLLQESIANESDEERSSRQLQDYEEIRKSYAELESTYMKFLSDSGLSRSGYWRGSVTQLQEEI
jgi:hypothetical protein